MIIPFIPVRTAHPTRVRYNHNIPEKCIRPLFENQEGEDHAREKPGCTGIQYTQPA